MSNTPQRIPRGLGRWLTVRSGLLLVAAVSIAALLAALAVNTIPSWERFQGLRGDSATGELGGEASLPLFAAAQNERTAAAVYVADPTPRHREQLDAARAQTDAGAEEFDRLSGTELEQEHRSKWEYIERVYERLEDLEAVRDQVDTDTAEASQVTDYYTELLATMIEFYQELSAMDDSELMLQTRPLVGLFWASEGLAQQDTVISQAVASGRMTEEQREQFAAAYGTQQVMYERWIVPYLPPAEQKAYQDLTESEAWQRKTSVQEAILSAPASTGVIEQLPPEMDQWPEAFGEVAGEVADLNLARTQGLLNDGYERADQVRNQVLWYTGIGLAAIIVIATLIVTITRSIARRLDALRATAERTAQQLPDVVERVRAGETVTIDQPDTSAWRGRSDEFGRVQTALYSTEQVALRLAAEQAGERQGLSRFVGLTASRALAPLERMLDSTENLQRVHERDVPLVRKLVGVERLALMLRRLLDDQLALAGEQPHQPYTDPKPLADLVNDAAAESTESERVSNRVRADVAIVPQAVNDIMHVVSALLDNALRFSAQEVTVTSQSPVHGTALEIVDLGTGMQSQHDYDEANQRLEKPQSFGAIAQGDGRLGLFVVAWLADRHGLRVRLRPSDYGGVKAIVLLPYAVHASASETGHATIEGDHAIHAPGNSSAVLQGAYVHGDFGSEPTNAELPDQPAPTPLPRRTATPRSSDGDFGNDSASATAPDRSAPVPLPRRTTTRSSEDTPTPEPTGPVEGSHAPPLPKRAAGTHMARELTAIPEPPRSVTPDDRSPEDVGAEWGAWQEGIQAGETQHTRTGDATAHQEEDT